MRIVPSYLAGLCLSALGAGLLNVSLEQILDPERPDELCTQAGVAGLTGLAVIVIGLVVGGLAAWFAKQGEKTKIFRMVLVLMSVPTGIAFSLAVSLLISAAIALLSEAASGGVVTILGFALIAGGYFLSKGFWRKLGNWLLDAIQAPQ